MFEVVSTHEILVTAIIGEHQAVKPAWLRPGQTNMPVVATNRFRCSVSGEGQYLGEVINEVLEEGDVRQAEYRADGFFHVLRDDAPMAWGSRTAAAETSA